MDVADTRRELARVRTELESYCLLRQHGPFTAHEASRYRALAEREVELLRGRLR